jgi:hypothetical protein
VLPYEGEPEAETYELVEADEQSGTP